jgi:hypothetical protein
MNCCCCAAAAGHNGRQQTLGQAARAQGHIRAPGWCDSTAADSGSGSGMGHTCSHSESALAVAVLAAVAALLGCSGCSSCGVTIAANASSQQQRLGPRSRTVAGSQCCCMQQPHADIAALTASQVQQRSALAAHVQGPVSDTLIPLCCPLALFPYLCRCLPSQRKTGRAAAARWTSSWPCSSQP